MKFCDLALVLNANNFLKEADEVGVEYGFNV